MEIKTHESGKANIIDDDGKYTSPNEIKLRLWDSGHVQVGAGGRFHPIQNLNVGEMYKFRLDGYVVAVKKVEAEEKPKLAPILRLAAYQAMRKPGRRIAMCKSEIIKLR